MGDHCPHCGALKAPTGFSVDLDTNHVRANGQALRVRPRMADFLATLAEADGKPIQISRLRARTWGMGNEPDDVHGTIRVYVYNARKLLARLGYTIATVRRPYGEQGSSYALVPLASGTQESRP